MRTLYLLALIYIGFFLSGCATPHAATDEPLKDPASVAIKDQPDNKPYHVLGTATLSQYNKAGIKRQLASIHDGMRTIATYLGGDAIVRVKEKDRIITGTVIVYQDSVKKNMLHQQQRS